METKSAGRKCSICTHEKVKIINSLIINGSSFRDISGQFALSKSSVQRHTENCLNLEIRALIKENKIENAIDHYQEIRDQLQFAKELRLAAREYLADEFGRLTLIPRADEIEVVYEDLNDTTPQGNPKKKTDSLAVLLERVKGISAVKTVTRHVDIRQFALNAVNTVDTVLDKHAKLGGLYQQDKVNNNDLAELKKIIEISAQRSGISYREELKYFIENFAEIYKPDLVAKLVSEMEN